MRSRDKVDESSTKYLPKISSPLISAPRNLMHIIHHAKTLFVMEYGHENQREGGGKRVPAPIDSRISKFELNRI